MLCNPYIHHRGDIPDSGSRLEPIIRIYTRDEARRVYEPFDNFIIAAFWIGMEYRVPEGRGNVRLVRTEVYSADERDNVEELKTFVELLLDRAIDNETKFFVEPPPTGEGAQTENA